MPTAALYPWLPVEATPRRAMGLGFRANVSEIVHTPLEDVDPGQKLPGMSVAAHQTGSKLTKPSYGKSTGAQTSTSSEDLAFVNSDR